MSESWVRSAHTAGESPHPTTLGNTHQEELQEKVKMSEMTVNEMTVNETRIKTAPEPPIFREVGRLSSITENIQSAVNDLEDRISRILGPDLAASDPNSGEDSKQESQFSEWLGDKNLELLKILGQLQRIRVRVEL